MLRCLVELRHSFTEGLVDTRRILNLGLVLGDCARLELTDLSDNITTNT